MPAFIVFVRERTRDQSELDVYATMAPAGLAGHPLTFRAHAPAPSGRRSSYK